MDFSKESLARIVEYLSCNKFPAIKVKRRITK